MDDGYLEIFAVTSSWHTVCDVFLGLDVLWFWPDVLWLGEIEGGYGRRGSHKSM